MDIINGDESEESSVSDDGLSPELKAARFKRADGDLGQSLGSVLQEFNVHAAQQKKRRSILRDLEKKLDPGKKSGVLAFIGNGAISGEDIPAFGDALLHIGDVDVLNLLIDSPGGDGTVAEKLIKLCRSYAKTFRVIIPHRAKSAATIIALGADEIVMGFCSELGPIDAQIYVMSNGVPQLISAQSFIDAKTELEDKFQECKKKSEDPAAILQEIATLDIPFIQHCERLMEFGKDVVKESLSEYMFASETKKEAKIKKILHELSAVKKFKVHGRMIDGGIAKTKLGLKILQLGKDDARWDLVWGYYLRASVLCRGAGTQGGPVSKLVETKSSLLLQAPM